MTALALLLPAAQGTPASSIDKIAARLAADTQHLADVRDDLDRTRRQLHAVRSEHRRLRVEVESRLVSVYMHGGTGGALARLAGGESMRDVGSSIEALDQVAEQDALLLRRWQLLDQRRSNLAARRSALLVDLSDSEQRVRAARERLSRAEAAAARARREAARMARIADSPLLPNVGSPENQAVEAGTGDVSSGQPIGFVQSGIASYYSDSFTGERTANGETYDPSAFTAAHPSLPFGTWVTVTGPSGSVAVRINDRGPFVGGRIIDLSRAAASAIGVSLGDVTLNVSG